MSDFDDAFEMSDDAAFAEMPAEVVYNGLNLPAIISSVGTVGTSLGPGGFSKTNTQRVTLKKADVLANNVGVGQKITVEGEVYRIQTLNPAGSSVVVDCGPLGDSGRGGAF
ncbi:MAG: hypothetical protein WCO60_18390 [Verrucomicrobiota bacterium]